LNHETAACVPLVGSLARPLAADVFRNACIVDAFRLGRFRHIKLNRSVHPHRLEVQS